MFKLLKLRFQSFSAMLFALLVLNSLPLAAQLSIATGALKGVVVQETKKSLPFAAVLLKKSADSSVYKVTSSADDGSFTIQPLKPGTYFIEIRALGYQTYLKKDILINETNRVIDLGNIQLIQLANTLAGVTISGKRPFIEIKPDKTIINIDHNMADSPSILDGMDRLPGVQVNPVDDQLSLNNRPVQIYIDGKATNLNSTALAGLLRGMSPSSIQKIELIANPSAKFEAAAGSGIINIIRKKNYAAGINANIYGTLGQGDYGKQIAGGNLNYKGKGYNVLLSGNYNYNKYFFDIGLLTDSYQNDQLMHQTSSQINSIRSNRAYTPTLGLDFYLSGKTTLSYTGVSGIQRIQRNAESFALNESISAGNLEKDLFLNRVKTKADNFSSGLHLLHQIDTLGKEFTVDLDYYNNVNNSVNDNLSINYNGNGGSDQLRSFLQQDRKFNIYAVKADYTLPLKGDGKIEAGLKSSYVKSENGNLNAEDPNQTTQLSGSDHFQYTEQINALYTTLSKSYKKLSVQLGVRAEHTIGKGLEIESGQQFNKNYLQVFPSAFFSFRFNKNHNLQLTLNKNINRPSYENLNPLVRILDAANYQQGNPDLKPSIAYNSSATYFYKNALYFTAGYSFIRNDFTSFSGYYEDSNIITTKPENNKYTQYFHSHIAYYKQVLSWWLTSTSVNFNQRMYRSDINGNVLNSNGIAGFGALTFNNFSITKKFSLLFLTRYTGKFQERNIINDPSFNTTIGMSQRLFHQKATLGFNVTDVFNTFKSRYTQNSGVIRQVWNNHIESRIARLTFTYSFGGNIKSRVSKSGADDEKKRTNTTEGQ